MRFSDHLRFSGLLTALLATLPLLARGTDALFTAQRALEDRLPDKAEAAARKVYADRSRDAADRDQALDILFQAMVDQRAYERLLETFAPDGLEGPELPSDGRVALWRSEALRALGQPEEALRLLRGALPGAKDAVASRIRRSIPPAVLATGDTNAALTAYADLRAVLADRGSPDVGMPTLERARIFLHLGQPEKALAELNGAAALAWPDNPEAEPTGDQAAARLLRAAALLHLDDPDGMSLLETLAADESAANAAVRPDALVLLAKAERESDMEASVRCARQAADLAAGTPAALEALRLLATTLHSLGRPEEARPHLDRFLAARESTPAERAGLVLDCAKCALAPAEGVAPDPQTALSLYDELLRDDPGVLGDDSALEAQAHYGRGQCLLALQQPDAATVAFQRAEEGAEAIGDKTLGDEARFRAAQACRDSGKLEDALRLFEALTGEGSALPASLRGQAALQRALAMEGLCADTDRDGMQQVENAYDGLLRDFPDDVEIVQSACLHLAALAMKSRNFSDAYRRCRAMADYPAIASQPELRCMALIGAGVAAMGYYNFKEALGAFQEASEADATNAVQAAYLRIEAYHAQGNDTAATNACQTLIDEHPGSPWAGRAARWLGIFLYNQRQFEAAASNLLFFADCCPDEPEDAAPRMLLVAAQALLSAKAYTNAHDTAKGIVDRYPDSPLMPDALLLQGETFRERMLYLEAHEQFNKVAKRWSGTPYARRATRLEGYCLFALGAEDASRYEEARKCFQQLLSGLETPTFEEKLELNYRIGRCLERLNDPSEAFDSYYDVVLTFETLPPGEVASNTAIGWYSNAILNAAELARNLSGKGESPVKLLNRLVQGDYPMKKVAEERLREYQH